MTQTKITRRQATVLASAGAAIVATPAMAKTPHPQMHSAVEALEQAKAHLREATANKGGHRAKAMEYIDMAISEVKRGIKYANS